MSAHHTRSFSARRRAFALGATALARCKWKGHEAAVVDAGGTLPRWQLAALATALRPRLQRAFIRPDVTGSDHCPVGIEIT